MNVLEILRDTPAAIGTAVGSIFGALGAVTAAMIGAIIGARKINSQSSYKILTEHRLKQFEEISAIFTKLRNLCDEYYIKSIKNTGREEYICELYQAINRLKTMFSCENFQEKYVIMEYDILIAKIEEYLDGNDDKELVQIEEQREVAFLLSNIYSWSLWLYIQKLYKSNKKLGKTLDEMFENVYNNTKELNRENKLFSIYFINDQHNLCRRN